MMSYPKSVLLGVNRMTQVVLQTREAKIERIRRAVIKFSGDGSIDVSEWLDLLERYCRMEEINPVEIIRMFLEGTAAMFFNNFRVSDSREWSVVRRGLLREFGMPPLVAYRLFKNRVLKEDEPLGVYIDDLIHYGEIIGAGVNDMYFRIKLFEGMPPSVQDFAPMISNFYECDFNWLISQVTDILSRGPHRFISEETSIDEDTAQLQPQNSNGQKSNPNLKCVRCAGPHRVRDCTIKRNPKRIRKKSVKQLERTVCFRCRKSGHLVRDCPGMQSSSTTSENNEETEPATKREKFTIREESYMDDF